MTYRTTSDKKITLIQGLPVKNGLYFSSILLERKTANL